MDPCDSHIHFGNRGVQYSLTTILQPLLSADWAIIRIPFQTELNHSAWWKNALTGMCLPYSNDILDDNMPPADE